MTASANPLDRVEAMDMNDAKPYILLVNRVVLALIFLYHGWPKAMDLTMATEKFIGFGLPGILGPVVGWAEVIFGLTLLVGIFTRLSSLVLGFIIVVAILTVQVPGGISAGLERDAMILVGCLAAAAYGPGAMALRSGSDG